MPAKNKIVYQQIVLSGDFEKLQELLSKRLVECGWKDQMRTLCRDVVKESDATRVSMDMLLERVLPIAKSAVPNTVKNEILQNIMIDSFDQNKRQ